MDGDTQTNTDTREDWPRFPAPPRSLERAHDLVAMAGDGNIGLVLSIGCALLGAMVGMVALAILDPESVLVIAAIFFGCFLGGFHLGKQISTSRGLAVLREGVEVRGEVVKIISQGQEVRVVYHYDLDGEPSRHDVGTRIPKVIRETRVGVPVLVLRHPTQGARHLVFLAAQFDEVRARLGGVPAPPSGALAVVRAAQGAAANEASGTPRNASANEPRSAAASEGENESKGRSSAAAVREWGSLPPLPRSLPLVASLGLRAGLQPAFIAFISLVFVATFIFVVLTVVGVLERGLWTVAPVAVGMLLFSTQFFIPPLLGRRLLRFGVEGPGTIVAVEMSVEGRLSYRYRYEVGGRSYEHHTSLLAPTEAAEIREGDPVLVLYDRSAPQRSVGLREPEARKMIAARR